VKKFKFKPGDRVRIVGRKGDPWEGVTGTVLRYQVEQHGTYCHFLPDEKFFEERKLSDNYRLPRGTGWNDNQLERVGVRFKINAEI